VAGRLVEVGINMKSVVTSQTCISLLLLQSLLTTSKGSFTWTRTRIASQRQCTSHNFR
jgi:hypothetical protein